MHPRLDGALVAKEADLRLNLSLAGLLPLLEREAGGFLVRAEKEYVSTAGQNNAEMVSRILGLLRKKGDAEFYSFLVILDKSGNESCANSLREHAGLQTRKPSIPAKPCNPSVPMMRDLMPYTEDLAAIAYPISGWLNLGTKWTNICAVKPDPRDRVQALLEEWLEGPEDPEIPHTWAHLLQVIRGCKKGKLAAQMEKNLKEKFEKQQQQQQQQQLVQQQQQQLLQPQPHSFMYSQDQQTRSQPYAAQARGGLPDSSPGIVPQVVPDISDPSHPQQLDDHYSFAPGCSLPHPPGGPGGRGSSEPERVLHRPQNPQDMDEQLPKPVQVTARNEAGYHSLVPDQNQRFPPWHNPSTAAQNVTVTAPPSASQSHDQHVTGSRQQHMASKSVSAPSDLGSHQYSSLQSSSPRPTAIIQGIHTQQANYSGHSPGIPLFPPHQPTAPVVVPKPTAPAIDPILNSRPIESDVLLHLSPHLSAQWKNFSTCLQFQPNQREIIAEDNHCKSDNCFMAVITQWLQKKRGTGDLPRTWETLLQVVCDLGHSGIAGEVHRALAAGAASTGVPLSQPTPPPQPRPLQQERKEEEAGEVEAFLLSLYDDFMAKLDIHEEDSAMELCDAGIVPEEVKTSIVRATSVRRANGILYDHLKKNADWKTLSNLCDVLKSDAFKGCGQNGRFARLMQQELQPHLNQPRPLQQQQEKKEEEGEVEGFLRPHYTSFLKDIDAQQVALELNHHRLIPDSVRGRIEQALSREKANGCLYDHLRKDATLDSLDAVLSVMLSEHFQAYTRMYHLAKKLQEDLRDSSHRDFKRIDDHHSKVYREAVEAHGCIKLTITKCTTIGPPRIGKTCLKHLLTKPDWYDVSQDMPSTEAIRAPEWVECFRGEANSLGRQWKAFSRKERILALYGSIASTHYGALKPKPNDSPTLIAEHRNIPENERELPSFTEKTEPTVTVSAPKSDPTASEEYRLLNDELMSLNLDKLQEDKEKKGQTLHKMQILHFIDTGGQSVYHDVHPVLITSPSVYLVVFNLMECFSEMKSKDDFLSSDLTQKALRSIHTLSSKNPPWGDHIKYRPEQPKIFIIGTHLDVLTTKNSDASSLDKVLKDIHEYIQKKMVGKPYRNYLMYDINGRCFWAVNNLQAGKETDKYLKDLRELIVEESMTMRVKLPITWFILEHIAASCKPIFEYDNIFQMARDQQLVADKKEFDALLHVFHILGLFFVPGDDATKTYIFTDPNLLYSLTSHLLLHLIDSKNLQPTMHAIRKAIPHLIHTMVEKKQLKEAISIDLDWFISLLCQLRLMAPLGEDDTSECIIPSILPNGSVSFEGSVTSLLLTYYIQHSEFSFIPSGLFCALIADVICPKPSMASFKVVWEPPQEPLYRCQVVFKVDFGEVCIQENHSNIQFDVKFEPRIQKAVEKQYCNRLREDLCRRLVAISGSLYQQSKSDFDAVAMWGIPCQYHKNEHDPSHLAVCYKIPQTDLYCATCMGADPQTEAPFQILRSDRDIVWFADL